MLDHIAIGVSDMSTSLKFYDEVLGKLGITRLIAYGGTDDLPDHVGYGSGQKPDFWVGVNTPFQGYVHICLAAESRAAVDAFHAAAMEAGASDNGPPGLRPHYHPGYYGAFVIDLNGCNLEAVHHTF